MRPLASLLVLSGVLAAVAVGLGGEWSRVNTRAGVSLASSPAAAPAQPSDLTVLQQQDQLLEQEKERLRRSCAALDHLSVRLVVGDITLAEAAALAEAFVRHRPGFDTVMSWQYPGAVRRVALAQFLIQRAEARCADQDPSLWYPARLRLEQELATLQQQELQ
ncbi:MAG: hypothetical protein NZ703_12190 [Gemmataceae bacterium]|nr:hypothetical protein [Gemmataceae bacterium]MCS7271830.1 hypothetical protein [Gemmataceae bacterium]MDW8243869.1 hypothetical protein [Thermogemmata sp.]